MNTPTPTHVPPIVHTHRKPGTITAQQVFANRRKEAERTTPPTHYGTPRPMLDELRLNNLTAGRTHE